MSENGTTANASDATPRRKIGRPFQPGQSGNPSGRPKIEPRIRKRARRYDSKVVAELWSIGSDPKIDADVRRKALMDLQAIGNGKPVTSQELVRPDVPQGPLVQMNFGAQAGANLSPDQAYQLMINGQLPEGADHPAFKRGPRTIEAEPAPATAVEPVSTKGENGAAPEPCNAAVEGITDKRVSACGELREVIEGLTS